MLKLILDILLFAGIWYFAIYTLNPDKMDRIAFRQGNTRFEKYLLFGAKAIVGIVALLQGIILFNRKWVVSAALESGLQTPPNTHFMYLAGIIVLYHAVTQMTFRALESERYMLKVQKKAIIHINGMLVVSAVVIITFFQFVFWGEMRDIYSKTGTLNLPMEIFVDGVLILIPGTLLLINTLRFLKKEKIRKLGLRISMPIVLFVAFTQMLFAKVAVWYELAVWAYEKWVLEGKTERSACDDQLLMATSLTFGKPLAKINAYFMASYFIVMLMVWTLQGNAFYLTNPLYMDGYKMSMYLTGGILAYWFVEAVSRLAEKLVPQGDWLRILFVPLLLTLTIYPFYTPNAVLNTVMVPVQAASIYHTMASALGQNKYVFFLCLAIMQAVMAYILHIVTGEAHNDRHYYSVLPITFIVQILVLAIAYPIFLSMPPYALLTNRIWIVGLLAVLGIAVTIMMSALALKFFTSSGSEWASYVSAYWKDKTRIYVIVGLITIFAFMPIFSIAIHPINNKGIEFGWEAEFFESDSTFHVQSLFNTGSTTEGYMLASDENSISRLIAFSLSDGVVAWEKVFGSFYSRYKVWDDKTVVLLKNGNRGFSVVSLTDGTMQYDYTVKEPEKLEFLNIEINDRAVLVTVDTQQFIFDHEIGQMQLDTMGNNFYKLIPGNYCALTKNSNVYVYQNERWEKVSGIQGVEEAQLMYYDEDGMLIFGKDEIIKYNAELTMKDETVYPKAASTPIDINGSAYSRDGEEVTFYMREAGKQSAYVFDVAEFTYQVIALQQKIKGYADTQRIKGVDEVGKYILMDDYQFTLMQNENLVARQWYQIPLTKKGIVSYQGDVGGEPVVIAKQALWAEEDGTVHSIVLP